MYGVLGRKRKSRSHVPFETAVFRFVVPTAVVEAAFVVSSVAPRLETGLFLSILVGLRYDSELEWLGGGSTV